MLFGVGLFLLTREDDWGRLKVADLRALGSSILTGAVVTLALFAVQLYLDDRDEQEREEEQYRLSLGDARDLTGLDPAYPIAGLSLPQRILDGAQLAGEDLTDMNLQGASLQEAHLEGAVLENASLFRADLEGAGLVGADLDGADLRAANLRNASIYGAEGVALSLDGTQVDARTCWPADILVADDPAIVSIRQGLEQVAVERTGRVIQDPAVGHACELSFSDLIQHLQIEEPPTTLLRLAETYDVTSARLLSMLRDRVPRVDAESPPLSLANPICAGTRRVVSMGPGSPVATAILVIQDPADELGEARTMLVDADGESVGGGEIAEEVHLGPEEPLPEPLERGSRLRLFGASVAYRAGPAPDHAIEREVSAC